MKALPKTKFNFLVVCSLHSSLVCLEYNAYIFEGVSLPINLLWESLFFPPNEVESTFFSIANRLPNSKA